MNIKKFLGGSLIAVFAFASLATTAGATTYTWSSNLKQGSKGAAVKDLQTFLNWCPDTQVAASGVGSKGKETTSFGAATKKAVMAFQKKNGISQTGTWGPMSAAAAVKAQAVTPFSCGAGVVTPTGPTTPTQTGPVTAMLSSDNPAAGTIVAGQATADLMHVTFTGSGTVNSVTLQRTGISDQNTLTNVYLYDGVTRLTDGYSFNTNGTLTMNNLNLMVNGSKTISVKADVYGSTTSNDITVALTGFTVGTSANTVSIKGNNMFIASNGSLATVGKDATGVATGATGGNTVGTATVNAGTSSYTVFRQAIQVGTRTVWLKAANFRVTGSAPADALQNVGLYIDGVKAGNNATLTMTNGSNYQSFDMSAMPVQLTTGSHTIEVRADIARGASYNFTVSLQQASDLMIVDPQVGVNLSVCGNTTVPCTTSFSASTTGIITIGAGSATFVVDPSFSAMTNVTGGASNTAIAKFKIHGYGENVKVTSLTATPVLTNATPAASGLQNVSLYFNGAQIGSQQAWTSGALTFNLGSQLIIPAGADSTLEVRADLRTTAGTNYTAGTISANLGTGTGEGWTSHTTVTTPAVNGTTLSIQTGLLAVSKNAGYSNQNITSNTPGTKIGSYVLQNQSSSESVRVTSLKVDLAFAAPTYTSGTVTTGSQAINVSSTTGFTVGNVITIAGATPATGTVTAINSGTQLQVNITSGGVTPTASAAIVGSGATSGPASLTSLSGLKTSETSGSGSTPVQPQSSNTFSVDFVLAPGATKTIDILADTSTANLGAATASLTVTSIGSSSNVSTTSSPITGQTVTFASGTVATPTLLTASATTSQYVAAANGGAADATKATYNFTSAGGMSTISELTFSVTGTTAATAVKVNGVSAPVVGGIAYLTGLNFAVPNGGSGLNLDVFVSYPEVGSNGIASGTTSQLALTTVKYTSGGNTATISSLTVNAPTMTLVGSKPTLTAAKPSAVVAAGNVEAIDVTVMADAKGNIVLNTLPVTVTPAGSTLGTSANTVIVKDANNTTIATTNTAFVSTGSTTVITFTNGYTIQAGQSQTFKIYVPVAGVTGTGVNGASLSSALATGANFSWTDTAGNASSAQTGTTLIPSYPNTFTSVIYN